MYIYLCRFYLLIYMYIYITCPSNEYVDVGPARMPIYSQTFISTLHAHTYIKTLHNTHIHLYMYIFHLSVE